MCASQKHWEVPRRSTRFRFAIRGHRPLRFIEELLAGHRTGDRVNHASLRRAEIAGDVAAVPLQFAVLVNDFETSDLLIRRYEMVAKISRDLGV